MPTNSLHPLFSRRRILQNTALMALVAPVIGRRDARAQAISPRRLVLIYSPNGPCPAAGPATGSETSFTVHDWWRPLERHKADGIFLSHMAPTGARQVAGGGHDLGGQIFSGFGNRSGRTFGPTIDQIIGKRLEEQGRAGIKRSVVWGASSISRSGGVGDIYCATANRQIVPEISPAKAWAELFAGFTAPSGDPEEDKRRAEALIARERSVLDFVVQDCKTLGDVLGKDGMVMLEEHCSTLRAMEKNLVEGMGVVPASGRCRKPAEPSSKDWGNPENIDEQMFAFIDLTATALACELTRVVAFQFAGMAARNRLASKYGVPSSPRANSGDSGPAHHPWTHQNPSEAKSQALRTFNLFYANQTALLVDKLKATVDARGKPLIDSTVVIWASEQGGSPRNRDHHQTGSLPVAIFGNGQGTFKTGRYIRGKSEEAVFNNQDGGQKEAGRDMARVLVSLVQYMGLQDVNRIANIDVTGPFAPLHG